MAAPVGNANAQRHGLRSVRLPAKCRYLELAAFRIRRELEDACIERFGKVDIRSAALIQSVGRHEIRASLAARWLRLEGDRLSIDQRIALLKEIGTATNSRDKSIDALALEPDPQPDEDVDSRAFLKFLRALPDECLQILRRERANLDTPITDANKSALSRLPRDMLGTMLAKLNASRGVFEADAITVEPTGSPEPDDSDMTDSQAEGE